MLLKYRMFMTWYGMQAKHIADVSLHLEAASIVHGNKCVKQSLQPSHLDMFSISRYIYKIRNNALF